MVKQPAPVHGVQGLQGHLPGALSFCELGIPQEEDQFMGCGKLGRGTEPAPFRVIEPGKLADSLPDKLPIGRAGAGLSLPPQVGGKGFSGGQHPRPVFPPQSGRLTEQMQKLDLRQLGPRPEGFLVRGEQHRQRPAAGAVHGHARRHMHREAKNRRNTLCISRFFNKAERKICRLNGCGDLFSASLKTHDGDAWESGSGTALLVKAAPLRITQPLFQNQTRDVCTAGR